MPENTKKKDAIFSAVLYSVLDILGGILCLYIRHRYAIQGIGGAVLLIAALLELGSVIPIQITLKQRLNEIDGGEEDAAAQY